MNKSATLSTFNHGYPTVETSMGGVLDFSKLIGDVVPSTYPVIKLNQNVSNDSTFAELRKRELRQLEEEILKLMPIQRHNFERIRDKLEHQTNQVDELAVAMERQ